MAPARPVDGGSDPFICNPNAISGTDCPIQGPLPSQSVQFWLFKRSCLIMISFGSQKQGFWRSNFDENQCHAPERHFWRNWRFALMKTQFCRFSEPENHTNIIRNSMHNGIRQNSISKIWKTKLWGRNFVLQGTLRRPKADTRCIQVPWPSQYRRLFCALVVNWDLWFDFSECWIDITNCAGQLCNYSWNKYVNRP